MNDNMQTRPGNQLRLILGLFVAVLAASCAVSKTDAETNLYTKTVRKPTVKGAEKFLQQYPNATYAPTVLRLRDSLLFFALDPEDAAGVLEFAKAHPTSPFKTLASERILRHNTSTITKEEALSKAGPGCLDATGWRKDNEEHIVALDDNLTLRILSPDGTLQDTRCIPVYTLDDNSPAPVPAGPLEAINPFGSRSYLHLAYLNGDSEYVEILYLPAEDILSQAMFYGTPVKPGKEEKFRIEGQSPEMMEGLSPTAEVLWLTGRLRENPSLVQLSRADLLSDNAIRWWLDRNPRAGSGASRLTFGQLDPESSIVSAYKKARKEKGKASNAALFDIRGYTVICASSRATGDYTLVWCEPVCKNRKRDKFLNSIYFESDGTTLDLFYYKGSDTFKLKISLPSQTLRR